MIKNNNNIHLILELNLKKYKKDNNKKILKSQVQFSNKIQMI